MDGLHNLQIEIEALRKELDAEAAKGLNTQECMKISAQLDWLVNEYMRRKGERLRRTGEMAQAAYLDARVELPRYYPIP
ncbi:MAG: Spo0E family sporulation regulatory protein-aspartic acid phosphatase [Lachnospiraceae bacterium]|jgi:hypothetical protein|nr:Spo0E family sporulation regulatory protein-aspartic acid phosphatase [Lachnospiraceae bacterium]